MKTLSNRAIILALLTAVFAVALSAEAFGQKIDETILFTGNGPETVVRPVEVSPVESSDKKKEKIGRVIFQKSVTVTPTGSGINIVAMQIPAGKRLVIENVSANVRCLESQKMEVSYSTYMNNGGGAQMTVHRLMLQRQGSFNDSSIFTANQKTEVLADEKIGSEHFSVGVSVRPVSGTVSGFVQAQFTFTGYLEDLPAVK